VGSELSSVSGGGRIDADCIVFTEALFVWLDQIALEERHGFLGSQFRGLATPLYFAHEHCTLNGGDAKVGQTLLAGLLG
jgi:hypothetical protein